MHCVVIQDCPFPLEFRVEFKVALSCLWFQVLHSEKAEGYVRPAHCPIVSDKLKSLWAKVWAGILSLGLVHTLSYNKLSFESIAIDVAKSANFSDSLICLGFYPHRTAETM